MRYLWTLLVINQDLTDYIWYGQITSQINVFLFNFTDKQDIILALTLYFFNLLLLSKMEQNCKNVASTFLTYILNVISTLNLQGTQILIR